MEESQEGCLDLSKDKLADENMVVQFEIECETDNQVEEPNGGGGGPALLGDQEQADITQEYPEESFTGQDLEPREITIAVEDLLVPVTRTTGMESNEEHFLAFVGMMIQQHETNSENKDHEETLTVLPGDQEQAGISQESWEETRADSSIDEDLEPKKIRISVKKDLLLQSPIKAELEEDIRDQAVNEGFKKPMPIDCSKIKRWIPRGAPTFTDPAKPSTSKDNYQEVSTRTCDNATQTARMKKVITRKEYDKLKSLKKKGEWTEEHKAEESPIKKKPMCDTVAVIANGGLEYLTTEHARIIKYMLIEAMNEHLNQEIERKVDPWKREYLRFQGSAWVNPGYFVVKCEDHNTYNWICKWNPGILDNMKLKVIPYEWIQWPIKIGFFLNKDERPDPVEVKTQIWRQNGLETYHWKVDCIQRKQESGEPIGWYLTFWVPNTAYKGLKMREWTLWYKLLKTKVEIIKLSHNGQTDPFEMALKEVDDESQ